MDSKRVLLVEDHSDVRRMLRAGLESLGKDIQIMDVPSGEEGLLLTSRHEFDLIISDVRLAGISGLELFRKVRQRKPQAKVIIITGVVDPEVRQAVVNSGPNAYFFKPVPMPEFLETVSHYLGFTETAPISMAPKVSSISVDKPSTGLLDWLDRIRVRIQAKSMILLSRRGQVFIQSGELPDSSILPSLIPFVMVSLNLSERVSNVIESENPEDLAYFGGGKYNVFIAHVGSHFALVVLTESPTKTGVLGLTLQQLPAVVAELNKLIMSPQSQSQPEADDKFLEEPSEANDTFLDEPSASEPEVEDIDPKGIDEIFTTQSSEDLNPRQVDDFWNNLAKDTPTSNDAFTNAVSYEQARSMGLTPDDEN